LPTFFATFVFVFLLVDASPFLLDFFLVAIISWSLYVHTIINDLLIISPQLPIWVSFSRWRCLFHKLTIQLLCLFLSYRY
jgi:hypothetical protein